MAEIPVVCEPEEPPEHKVQYQQELTFPRMSRRAMGMLPIQEEQEDLRQGPDRRGAGNLRARRTRTVAKRKITPNTHSSHFQCRNRLQDQAQLPLQRMVNIIPKWA